MRAHARVHTHTETTKLTGFNKHCSLITFNINGLISQLKDTVDAETGYVFSPVSNKHTLTSRIDIISW